jgi:hypothetical protein
MSPSIEVTSSRGAVSRETLALVTERNATYSSNVTRERKPPLAFVDEDGQANLDVDKPHVGTHFVLIERPKPISLRRPNKTWPSA